MLLISIHDIGPGTLRESMLLRQIVEHACGGRVTLLVPQAPQATKGLVRCTKTCEMLKACAGLGDEIALHGSPEQEGVSGLLDTQASYLDDLNWRARHSSYRLREDRFILEDALAVPIKGFVGAPSSQDFPWLTAVLRECGFDWHAHPRWIDELQGRRRLCSPLLLGPEGAIATSHARSAAPSITRVALGPDDLRRPMLQEQLERLGRSCGPSLSITHVLQTERRGIVMPDGPSPTTLHV